MTLEESESNKFHKYMQGGRVDLMFQTYRKHYLDRITPEVKPMEYGTELEKLVQTSRKELTLSGDPRHRENVVRSLINRFVRNYVHVDLTLTLSEVEVMLDLLRSDGGPRNSIETNLILKLSFAQDPFTTGE